MHRFVADGLNFRPQLTLLIIMAAGFGHVEPWKPDPLSSDRLMSFRKALSLVISNIFVKMIFPKWVWGSAWTRRGLGIGVLVDGDGLENRFKRWVLRLQSLGCVISLFADRSMPVTN